MLKDNPTETELIKFGYIKICSSGGLLSLNCLINEYHYSKDYYTETEKSGKITLLNKGVENTNRRIVKKGKRYIYYIKP